MDTLSPLSSERKKKGKVKNGLLHMKAPYAGVTAFGDNVCAFDLWFPPSALWLAVPAELCGSREDVGTVVGLNAHIFP